MTTSHEQIRLEPVTSDNAEEVFALDPGEANRNFIAPNVRSVAQAYVYKGAEPYAVFAGDTLVGFVMLYPLAQHGVPEAVNLVRMMIDSRYQRQGLGRKAMEEVIRTVRERAGIHLIQLSVFPSNVAAIGLYESVGFVDTGQVEGGEKIFRLDLATESD